MIQRQINGRKHPLELGLGLPLPPLSNCDFHSLSYSQRRHRDTRPYPLYGSASARTVRKRECTRVKGVYIK